MQQGGWRRPHNGISEVSTTGAAAGRGHSAGLGQAETGFAESSAGENNERLEKQGLLSGSVALVPLT